ncbi:MAG: hypothetical protein WKG00_41150, partial [Polyangiaceae bacterium]
MLHQRGTAALGAGDDRRAVADLTRAEELLASDPEPSLTLARALLASGRAQDALAAGKRAIGRRQDH